MALDLNTLRNKLNSLNVKKDKPKDLWKPKDEHDIRLVPNSQSGDPIVERHFHYEIGESKSVLCPKLNFGKPCAICDFADMLKSWKDPKTGEDKPEGERKADFEIFKKIQPKVQYYVAMVERGHESDGAKWMKLTPGQLKDYLLPLFADGDRLESLGISKDDSKRAFDVLFGVDKGFDLHVSFAEPGKKGNAKTFPQTKFDGKIKVSPLAPTPAMCKSILDSVKNFNEVYPEVSSDEVEQLLQKFVNRSAEEPKPTGGIEYNKAQTNSKEDAKTVGKRGLEEAFNDLLKS